MRQDFVVSNGSYCLLEDRIKVPMVLRLEKHENGLEFCRFGLGYPNL